MKRIFLTILLAAATCFAHAQTPYPARQVRIVVPYAPGGISDVMTRILAQKLSETWGQPVLVDNRVGGATNIAAEIVARAAPDGYTLLNPGTANSVNVTLYSRLSFDIVKDFAPLTLLIIVPNVLVLHPSVAATSTKELIALAKAKPGELTYGTTGIASSGHLAGELFKMMAGVDLVHVPYKGGAPAVTALLAGELAMGFNTIPTSLPQIKAGKLRALAVTTEKRSALLPDLPTVAESGLPGYEMSAWQGLMAPAGTPPAIVAKLHADATRAISLPDVREKLAALGVEVITSTPAEFANFLKADIAKYAKLVKSIDLKAD